MADAENKEILENAKLKIEQLLVSIEGRHPKGITVPSQGAFQEFVSTAVNGVVNRVEHSRTLESGEYKATTRKEFGTGLDDLIALNKVVEAMGDIYKEQGENKLAEATTKISQNLSASIKSIQGLDQDSRITADINYDLDYALGRINKDLLGKTGSEKEAKKTSVLEAGLSEEVLAKAAKLTQSAVGSDLAHASDLDSKIPLASRGEVSSGKGAHTV